MPPGGSIADVTVFPSKIGMEAMAKEEEWNYKLRDEQARAATAREEIIAEHSKECDKLRAKKKERKKELESVQEINEKERADLREKLRKDHDKELEEHKQKQEDIIDEYQEKFEAAENEE